MKTLNVMLLRVLTVLAVCFALAGCLRSSDSNDDDLVEEDSSEEVGGDDVAVVPGLVVLVVVQCQQGDHLQLPDGVLRPLLGHMEHLYPRL